MSAKYLCTLGFIPLLALSLAAQTHDSHQTKGLQLTIRSHTAHFQSKFPIYFWVRTDGESARICVGWELQVLRDDPIVQWGDRPAFAVRSCRQMDPGMTLRLWEFRGMFPGDYYGWVMDEHKRKSWVRFTVVGR